MTSALVQRFALNTAGRDLIVGDIHGYFTKLRAALDAVCFSPADGDRLFSVGDLVDRGPESHFCIEWLDQPWFHAVAGNHEDMAIRWPNGFMPEGNYVANGGAWNVENTPAARQVYADALSVLPVAIEIETEQGTVGVVHAECPLDSWQAFTAALVDPTLSKARREAIIDAAQWSRDRVDRGDDSNVEGVRAVVVGHTPMQNWTSLGNTIFIDTGAWLPPHRGQRDFCLLDAKTLQPVDPPGKLQW